MSEDKDKQARASSSGAVNLMAGVGKEMFFFLVKIPPPDEIKHDILFRAMFCIYIIKYLL